jgi:hypothetical protein
MQWSTSRPNLLHKKFDLNSLIIVYQVHANLFASVNR